MSVSLVEEVIPRAPTPGVLAPAVLGFASGYVEETSIPEEVAPDTWEPWSYVVHNRGDTGTFGGAIENKGGPGPIKVKWRDEEKEILVGKSHIVYLVGAPNCTRFDTSGEILFPSAGNYKLRVHGVHLEGETWVSDHYIEFTVTVEVPPEWVWWWPWAIGGGGPSSRRGGRCRCG